MKKIITYGTFDILHYGHIRLLERAKALGDYLIVGVSTDEMCEIKGKKPYYNYEERAYMVKALQCVDEVIPEYTFDQKFDDFVKLGIDTFVIGSDYKDSPLLNNIESYCNLVILERTEGISTSQIKDDLNNKNIQKKKSQSL